MNIAWLVLLCSPRLLFSLVNWNLVWLTAVTSHGLRKKLLSQAVLRVLSSTFTSLQTECPIFLNEQQSKGSYGRGSAVLGNEVKCSDRSPFNNTVPSTSETDSLWENGKSELGGMSCTGNWFGIPESRWSIESSNLSAFSAWRQRHDRFFFVFSYKSLFSLQ